MASSGLTLSNGNGNGKKSLTFGALLAGSTGIGAMIAYEVISVMRTRPELFIDLVKAFGPMFLVVVALLVVGDKFITQFMSVSHEGAQATQRLADAVETVAKKDDRAAEQRDLLLNDIAYQVKTAKDTIARIEERQLADATFRAKPVAAGQGG